MHVLPTAKDNICSPDETHQINQNVRVLCGTGAQFSGVAGQELSAHTPPGQMGQHRAWTQSGEETEDFNMLCSVILVLKKSSVLLSTLIMILD